MEGGQGLKDTSLSIGGIGGAPLLYCYIYSYEYFPLMTRIKKLGSLEARKLGGMAPLAPDGTIKLKRGSRWKAWRLRRWKLSPAINRSGLTDSVQSAFALIC
jgi:hypothetical protein